MEVSEEGASPSYGMCNLLPSACSAPTPSGTPATAFLDASTATAEVLPDPAIPHPLPLPLTIDYNFACRDTA
jgi:hypothetical protein